MAEAKPIPAPPAPPAGKDPDDEFFEKEGVTDPEEKEAIKGRARVLRYAAWKSKQEEAEAEKEKAGKSKRPWHKRGD